MLGARNPRAAACEALEVRRLLTTYTVDFSDGNNKAMVAHNPSQGIFIRQFTATGYQDTSLNVPGVTFLIMNGNGGNDELWIDPSIASLPIGISGGHGDDILTGSTGDDHLIGDAGNDRLSGGDGKDKLYGGAHGDVIYGGPGNDRIEGGSGTDYLYGNEGDDDFYARDGEKDFIYGGPGVLDEAITYDGDAAGDPVQDYRESM